MTSFGEEGVIADDKRWKTGRLSESFGKENEYVAFLLILETGKS